MSSKKPATTEDLIDFSNNELDASVSSSMRSNEETEFLTDSVSSLLSQDHDTLTCTEEDRQFLRLDDYVRKPRTYSRERSPSNEERPPPLPPKRRTQSRKNQKLSNRLRNAGIKVTDVDKSVSSPYNSFDDPAVLGADDFKEQKLLAVNQPIPGENVISPLVTETSLNIFDPAANSVTSNAVGSKDHFKSFTDSKGPVSFESRLKDVIGQKDLIHENLMEFEGSSKPPRGTLPQKTLNSLCSNRASSMENLRQAPDRPSVNSLSLEDLEAFISDFAKTSTYDSDDSSKSGSSSMLENHMDDFDRRGTGISASLKKHPRFVRMATLPPPRPEPPKMFNRLSLPLDINLKKDKDSKLYFCDGIFDLVEERNEEAMEFCKRIADIRSFYRYSDFETNPGFISDSVINLHNAGWHRNVTVEVFYEQMSNPITIICDVFSKVQDIVLKALLVFQDIYRDIDTISPNKYIFKVCGECCYLEGNEPFINYSFVQNCMKLLENVNLMVVARSRISRYLARTEEDDNQESKGIYFKHFFKIASTTAISRQGLSVLIETYNCEVEKLISDVTKSMDPSYVPEKLIQTVKALSLSLAFIESSQVHEAVNLLLALKPKTRDSIVSSPVEHGVLDFNRIISQETFDKGRFNIALEKLTSAVYALIDSYCRAFDTDFSIHDPNRRNIDSSGSQLTSSERVSAGTINDKFFVKLSSAHRIPSDWKSKYDYFELECCLFYGGKPICEHVLTKLSRLTKGFYEHIKWDENLVFDIEVKEIPRETKLCIGLYGLTSTKRQNRDSRNRSELGWISCNLFDFKGLLISGSHLFGLLSGPEMNPAATCSSSNIQESSSVILRADFEVYHTEVIFPEVLVQTMQFMDYVDITPEIPQELDEMLNKGSFAELSSDEKDMVWKNRLSLRNIDKAFPYVLASVPNLKPNTLAEAQELVHLWDSLSPNIALGLLTASFPDIIVRTSAVNWFCVVSESELCDYLPQLVQALKYETYHTSALSKFLITSALKSPKVAHYLFWHLKYYTGDPQFSQRFQIVLGGLLGVCGAAMKDQLSRQELMVQQLAKTTQKVKETKDSLRRGILTQDLDLVAANIDGSLRLPVSPSTEVKGIISESCSYFNSFTVPLSIVFENSETRAQPIKCMFKVGDDLRKDLVTLQLFRVMNRLWLSESLDLKMVTYECMPTAPLAGVVHLVPNAATLREIHIQHGVTGSFKDDVIGLWLQKYNQSEGEYQMAVENFSASCAAYCVATYVLGIGDRHNDNIMVTQKGHVFHIDFSKFMGNVQKFGTIRRDRVPFVLTPDMAFVINFGEAMSHNFQHFVELCCDAFNIIRKNSDLILNLLQLMVSSGIPYLSTTNDIDYVRHALQLHLTDAQSTVFFTRLIETSLSSKSTQWNFFIHNMAHMKDSQSTSNSARAIFSFSSKVYSKELDGEILSVRCVDIQKRYVPDKHYIFVLNVLRNDKAGARFVFRKYDEFQELHSKLSQVFGSSAIPPLPGRILVGRSEIRDIAMKRRFELDEFLVQLMGISEFSNSEIIYTFLHSFIRDEQDSFKFADILIKLEQGLPRSRVGGEIKLSYQYSKNRLNLLVMHARNIVPRTIQGTADPYVKSYLLPDSNKSTKRKTRIARRNLNPTYNQTLSYESPMDLLQRKVLQVTVWDNDAIGVNDYLGGVNIYLSTHDLTKEKTQWYDLKDLGLGM